jgi:hypothetical protein
MSRASTPLKNSLTRQPEISTSQINSPTPFSLVKSLTVQQCSSQSEDDGETKANIRFDKSSNVLEISSQVKAYNNNENLSANTSRFGKRHNLQKFMAELGKDITVHNRTPMIERSQKQLKAAKNLESVTNPVPSDEETEEEDNDIHSNEEQARDMAYDRFFNNLKITKASTSNNTLSQLPILTSVEYADSIACVPKKHVEETKHLLDNLRNYFREWVFEFEYGFNIITYGF